MTSPPKTTQELEAEIDTLRQLLQAGVAFVTATLDGDDTADDLRDWLAEVQRRLGAMP